MRQLGLQRRHQLRPGFLVVVREVTTAAAPLVGGDVEGEVAGRRPAGASDPKVWVANAPCVVSSGKWVCLGERHQKI